MSTSLQHSCQASRPSVHVHHTGILWNGRFVAGAKAVVCALFLWNTFSANMYFHCHILCLDSSYVRVGAAGKTPECQRARFHVWKYDTQQLFIKLTSPPPAATPCGTPLCDAGEIERAREEALPFSTALRNSHTSWRYDMTMHFILGSASPPSGASSWSKMLPIASEIGLFRRCAYF